MADDKNKKITRRSPFDSDKDVPPGTPPRITSKALKKQLSPANAWFDASDFYANHFENYIQFTSVISKKSVKFKAFLTAFEDQFKSEWNSEQVYGRNDPIQTFKNTTRTINIGWDTPAASFAEAEANAYATAQLIRMLYPSYVNTGNVSTINKAPLIRVKFRNLIKDQNENDLLVTIDGINFSPDLEAGWFDKGITEPTEGPTGNKVDELIPKLLKFSCTMTVLHKSTIGHQNGAWPSRLDTFPNLPNWEFPDLVVPLGGTFGAGGAFSGIQQNEFNAEEEAAAQRAIDEATAALDSVETSKERKTKEERKQDRQHRKNMKKLDKIMNASSAADAKAGMSGLKSRGTTSALGETANRRDWGDQKE